MFWHVLAGDGGARKREKPCIGLFLLIFSDDPEIRVLGPTRANWQLSASAKAYVDEDFAESAWLAPSGTMGIGCGKLRIAIIRGESQGVGA